ncbi:MAG: molybdopterin converting factor subunit 1 [Halieaceae bacterium]|nr:molybdopterin converting factor subunit 1 [Halieaceae bacterium]
MIKVLFFARLREQLGVGNLELSPEEAGTTVAELRSRLQARGGQWADALSADNLLCALNQQQARGDESITAGDEVAFFPPVTGG